VKATLRIKQDSSPQRVLRYSLTSPRLFPPHLSVRPKLGERQVLRFPRPSRSVSLFFGVPLQKPRLFRTLRSAGGGCHGSPPLPLYWGFFLLPRLCGPPLGSRRPVSRLHQSVRGHRWVTDSSCLKFTFPPPPPPFGHPGTFLSRRLFPLFSLLDIGSRRTLQQADRRYIPPLFPAQFSPSSVRCLQPSPHR